MSGLSLHPHAQHCKELEKAGAKVIPHRPGRLKEMVNTLEQTGADTLCLILPTHPDKFDITVELIEAGKKENVPNICFMSSAGADLAERDEQPRLREFIDLEPLFISPKEGASTSSGPSPVDVALVAAHVLTGKGKHGFSDAHRGQLNVLTGPMLATGDELAQAATNAGVANLQFEDISEAEANKVLHLQSDNDQSKLQYLLEYYSLVREGKTNYISKSAFHDITGSHPQEPPEFFKTYKEEFQPQHANKKRKSRA